MPVSYTHLDVYKRQGYAYDVLGYRKVAILYEVSSEYSLGITQNLTESFEAKGGAVTITEAYNACLLYTSRCV